VTRSRRFEQTRQNKPFPICVGHDRTFETIQIHNTNPSRFEELANALATVFAYHRDAGLKAMQDDFDHLYRRALDQPPCYREVNELTGQSLSSGDRMAGLAAWTLLNIEQLRVYEVHSQVWHETGGRVSAPLLDQIATAVGVPSQLTNEDLQNVTCGKKGLIVDVVGLKGDDSVWIVQTMNHNRIIDSAFSRSIYGSKRLFKSQVFDDPVLGGQELHALKKSAHLMGRAFPEIPIHTFCFVSHPKETRL
jgi:hypothetical protein